MKHEREKFIPLALAALHILLALAAEVKRLEGVVEEARLRLPALDGGRA